MRWGLVPSWVKDPRKITLLINARSETINDKPAFKNAMRRRRCLIPADGYYEWQDAGGRKRPFFIYRRDRQPVGFAALAETWMGPNGEEVDAVAIVTAPASRDLLTLHHRVPVTITPDAFERWLDCRDDDAEVVMPLLRGPAEGEFAWHEISTRVNRVANDEPRPIREIIPEVPEWLVAVIAKLHAKNPADRYASAQEVADVLGRGGEEPRQQVELGAKRQAASAAPTRRPRRR